MDYQEQKKETIDGVLCQYLCHIQKVSHMGNVYPAHFHSYIEILYTISGTYEVYLNGRNHKFTKGDLVLINSKEVHQINAISKDGGKYIVLRFDPDIIYNRTTQTQNIKYILPFILENPTQEKIIKKQQVAEGFIPELLFEIMNELENKDYAYELAVQNHIGKIFLWVLRYWYQSGAKLNVIFDANKDLIKRIQPVLDYIMENYDKDIRSKEMAKLCNMSYSYFSRKFNYLMNMNFNEYVNYIRIKEAEKLLISTGLNVTEIAVSVGFNTTSYFIKLFKYYKNISPKQFKKEFV